MIYSQDKDNYYNKCKVLLKYFVKNAQRFY